MKDQLAKPAVEVELETLLKKREELDKQIDEFKQKEKQAALLKVREIIVEFNLSKSEVFSSIKLGKSPSGLVKTPKYRNPVTGQTWTGRGKEPGWVTGKRDQYRIAE